MADEVVFKEREIRDAVAKELSKPIGKFFPPPKFTEAELEKVTKLELISTQVNDAGLKEVAKLQKLEWLVLTFCNQITDAGLKELAKLQNLERLLLNDNEQITKAGVAELKKALPNCKIIGP